MVGFGHQHWDLVQNIMWGIQISLQNHDFSDSIKKKSRRGKKSRIIDSGDWNSPKFTETVTHLLNCTNSSNAGDNLGRWIFTEYCPHVFWKIREAFGIQTAQYESSLGVKELVGNLLLGRLRSYEEVSTQPLSFYLSF